MGKKTKKLPKYTVPIDCLCTGGLKTKPLSTSETVNHFTYLVTLCEYLFVVRASKSVIPYKEVPSDSTIYFLFKLRVYSLPLHDGYYRLLS